MKAKRLGTRFAIAVLVLAYVHVTFWLITSHRQSQKIRTALFQSIMHQDIEWFDTNKCGELNTRLSE